MRTETITTANEHFQYVMQEGKLVKEKVSDAIIEKQVTISYNEKYKNGNEAYLANDFTHVEKSSALLEFSKASDEEKLQIANQLKPFLL